MTDQEMELRDTLAIEITREMVRAQAAADVPMGAARESLRGVYKLVDAVLEGRWPQFYFTVKEQRKSDGLPPLSDAVDDVRTAGNDDEAFVRANWPRGTVFTNADSAGNFVMVDSGQGQFRTEDMATMAAAWADARRITEQALKGKAVR
jgi:hypothetical protein